MSRSIAISLMLSIATVLTAVIICEPSWLNDEKPFLKDFLNKDILSILGIILTITLASTAQLHLEFNKIEEELGAVVLVKSRKNVHDAARALIYLFIAAVCLVVIKPIAINTGSYRGQAFFNGAGLFILWINILVLMDITAAAFAIKPSFRGKDNKNA